MIEEETLLKIAKQEFRSIYDSWVRSDGKRVAEGYRNYLGDLSKDNYIRATVFPSRFFLIKLVVNNEKRWLSCEISSGCLRLYEDAKWEDNSQLVHDSLQLEEDVTEKAVISFYKKVLSRADLSLKQINTNWSNLLLP